jgi:mono/diheme cytochrome c family protein
MAAPIKFACPACGASLKAEEAPRPGKQARCPRCQVRFPMATTDVPVAIGVTPPKVPLAQLAGQAPAAKALPARPASSGTSRARLTGAARNGWLIDVGAIACVVLGIAGVSIILFAFSRHGDTAEPPPVVEKPPINAANVANTGKATDADKAAAPVGDAALSLSVRSIFETNCFRCHGEDGEAESGVFVLDRDKLVSKQKIIPGDPEKSRLYQRVTSPKRPMPAEDETPRPSVDDIATIKQWIAAGAPPFPSTGPVAAGAQLDTRYLLIAMRDYLLKTSEADRKYQRFFTLVHLANNPDENPSMPIYRAALAKLLNSLSWKKDIVQPRAIDPALTVYALDLRALDWETPDRWLDIERVYPYGLRYDSRSSAALRPLVEEIEHLAGSPLPYVRADWFIATGSRPPLSTACWPCRRRPASWSSNSASIWRPTSSTANCTGAAFSRATCRVRTG